MPCSPCFVSIAKNGAWLAHVSVQTMPPPTWCLRTMSANMGVLVLIPNSYQFLIFCQNQEPRAAILGVMKNRHEYT
eukprot:scaffold110_cov315-Pavlova_lutheri.AAC.44